MYYVECDPVHHFSQIPIRKKEEKDSPIGSCGIRKIRTNRVDTHMIVYMPQKEKVHRPPRYPALPHGAL
jgi:hypothetical protein